METLFWLYLCVNMLVFHADRNLEIFNKKSNFKNRLLGLNSFIFNEKNAFVVGRTIYLYSLSNSFFLQYFNHAGTLRCVFLLEIKQIKQKERNQKVRLGYLLSKISNHIKFHYDYAEILTRQDFG